MSLIQRSVARTKRCVQATSVRRAPSNAAASCVVGYNLKAFRQR